MAYYVICNNKFLGNASALIGPFATKDEATSWANEKDRFLTKDETFRVYSETDPKMLFQR